MKTITRNWQSVNTLIRYPDGVVRLIYGSNNIYYNEKGAKKLYYILCSLGIGEKEIVICAAVKTRSGKVFRGHRHADAIKVAHDAGWTHQDLSFADQGFITSRNRYVTREEGRKLQDAAGIKSADPEGYHGTTLFSEDLY